MTNTRFRNSGKTNRFIALGFTFLFHALFIGSLYYTSEPENSLKDFMPEMVKEWFDADKEESETKDKNRA